VKAEQFCHLFAHRNQAAAAKAAARKSDLLFGVLTQTTMSTLNIQLEYIS